jgi:hypothetical protein
MNSKTVQSRQGGQLRPVRMPSGQSLQSLTQQPGEITSGELLPAAAEAARDISQGIMRLCSAKNRAQMTRYDVETWCAVLSVYPADVVNLSVLEIALNSDPFPDLGKVVARCQAKMAERSQVPTQASPEKLSRRRLVEIARALEIDVGDGR